MVLKELLNPTNLLGAQTFYIYKMTKIIIVYKDENLIFAVF